jgi:hypothetical protein
LYTDWNRAGQSISSGQNTCRAWKVLLSMKTAAEHERWSKLFLSMKTAAEHEKWSKLFLSMESGQIFSEHGKWSKLF